MNRETKLSLVIIFILLIFWLLTSCDKNGITPGNYQSGISPQPDTTQWIYEYKDGGIVPY